MVSDYNYLTDNKSIMDDGSSKKMEYSEGLITGRDLEKELVIYTSQRGIIEKLMTFKIDTCGKYINVTRDFLCDPDFLKLAYYMIKSDKSINVRSKGINNQ
jgi:hypothetical protein